VVAVGISFLSYLEGDLYLRHVFTPPLAICVGKIGLATYRLINSQVWDSGPNCWDYLSL